MCEVDFAHGAATEQPYQPVLLELLWGVPFSVEHVTCCG